MKGAIAAGHPVTAEAGARVLAAGGNAVDACLAAAFASWVCESPLTGPGGGGFLLVRRGRRARVLDFFAAFPPGPAAAMEEVVVDFAGASTQVFRVGEASTAIPGTTAGLEQAHRAYASLPWRDLVEPAAALARRGVEMTEGQAFLHLILDGILRRTEAGRRVYGADGPLRAGETFRNPELAETLDAIAARGARAVEELVPQARGYRVVERRPLRVAAFGHELLTNPPPSAGGPLIAHGLLHLAARGRADAAALVAAMRAQERLRAGVGGTTHVSVLDADGTAASLSCSAGSGSGVFAGGFQLNNMLGELDLLGGRRRAGGRLSSMMAPSLLLRDGEPRLVLGSAGSNRLRGAILQVVVNVVAHGLGVEEAVRAPRLHYERGRVECEPGIELEGAIRWPARNLYFGGVSAVEARGDGTLAAAGDPRRGGHGIVVA